MLEAARACYPAFDEDEAVKWGNAAVVNPTVIAVRGEYGFAVASVVRFFYRATPQCFMVFLCAKPNARLEGYRLLKSVIQSARERGATKIHIGSETDFDFAPFARRLGWEAQPLSYALRL